MSLEEHSLVAYLFRMLMSEIKHICSQVQKLVMNIQKLRCMCGVSYERASSFRLENKEGSK